MKISKQIFYAALLILGALIGYSLTSSFYKGRIEKLKSEYVDKIDTLIVEKFDTITEYNPKPIFVTEIRHDTVPMYKLDTVNVHDTTRIVIPISSYYFTKDSLYDIWASGYNVKLDSINIFASNTTKIINKTLISPPKWQIGVNSGVGYNKYNGYYPVLGTIINTPSRFYFGGDINFYQNNSIGGNVKIGYYLTK